MEVPKWKRVSGGMGQPHYHYASFVIEPRWQWKYLGGGRSGSVRTWLLIEGDVIHGRFRKLGHAKSAVTQVLVRRIYDQPAVAHGFTRW